MIKIKKSFQNGNVCLYLAFLAKNGEGTLKERSEFFWERLGNGDEQKSNGTGTVQERKNYCDEICLNDQKKYPLKTNGFFKKNKQHWYSLLLRNLTEKKNDRNLRY